MIKPNNNNKEYMNWWERKKKEYELKSIAKTKINGSFKQTPNGYKNTTKNNKSRKFNHFLVRTGLSMR